MEQLNDVIIFGEVNLDHEERLILKNRPEFCIYDKICEKKMNEEMNAAMSKIRWDRSLRGWTMEEEKSLTPEERKTRKLEEEKDREEESQSRLVYDQDAGTIDMGARKATDMRHNTRIHLPQPRPPLEEAILEARMEVWKNATKYYTRDHCGKGGHRMKK